MTLHVTAHMAAGAYSFLRTTDPFREWSLPPRKRVRFKMINDNEHHGFCHYEDCPPIIEVSRNLTGLTETLLITVAHEMVHLKLKTEDHGRSFQALARQVCDVHGWDRKIF